jgi:hypothetical protein
MRLALRDLLEDPQMPARRIWFSVLRDLRGSFLHEHLANLTGGISMTRGRRLPGALVRSGAMFGCAILLIWITFRSFHLFASGTAGPQSPQGLGQVQDLVRLLAPWLMFAPAGYFGARSSGTFSGGIRAGLVAGVIAALTIPGDYLLFHHAIPGGVVPTTLTLAAAATLAMFFAAVGAALAVLTHGRGTMFRLGHLTVAWQHPKSSPAPNERTVSSA